MRRKRIVAKLMALSLLLSGLPMTSVYAAELPEPLEAVEQEVEGEETPVEDAAAEDTDEKETDSAENDASVEQEKETQDENAVTDETQQGDPVETETIQKIKAIGEIKEIEIGSPKEGETAVKELQVAENAKMAGSNGILYDGVTYLSVRNVLAMDEEMQELYRSLCDEIAASKEGGLEMQDIVFAVNANGDLYCSYYVPLLALEEIQADMLPDADGTLTPETEENSAEDKQDAETSEDGKDAAEEEKKDDETSEDGKDAAEEEKKDNETSEDGKDAAEEEKKDDETSEGGKDAVEEEKKDDETSEDGKDAAEEEKKDDETSEDDKDAVEEEKKDGETSEDGKNAIEEEKQDNEAVEDEQAAGEESDELIAENLDLIPEMEEETFEEIESVRIENTIDLGYGNGVNDGLSRSGIQFNAILPSEDYFVKQLSVRQKKYYNLAKGKLTKGSNTVSFQDAFDRENGPIMAGVANDLAHAVSALILAYPDKTDWMAKPGGFKVGGTYRPGTGVANYVYTFDKSEYYSGDLDSRAKTQMQTVGNLAQQYAVKNYPNTPVYGVVKYLDQWVCENGYYEMLGTAPLTGKKDADAKKLGLNNSQIEMLYEIYYNCHSAYGILLKGYGVCESYAKTMSRLLDAVGIPNIYVVGTAGSGRDAGGHAWNYVQMPDGSWYLLDSTWNDTTEPGDKISSGKYVLVKEDGEHHETGCNFGGEDQLFGKFTFPDRAGSNYSPNATGSFTLSKTTCNLVPKGKETLTYEVSGKTDFDKKSAVWSSSNTKVAKVDQKGKITAVAAGTADITVSGAGMTATCTVYVDQIKAVKTAANKTSESVSLGNTAAAKGSKTITLAVDMGASPHTAEWMIANEKTTSPEFKYSKSDVVTAAATVTGNSIAVKLDALKDGSSKVTMKFGGKTVTINVTAGQIITAEMFEITWPGDETQQANKSYEYTGKAIKPSVKKITEEPVTFKTTYVNNVNAGTAKVVVTGTGKYGGVLEYPFTITPIDITGADFLKASKSKVYNGGDNPPATVVKLGKKTLKVNKDYEILYNGAKPAGALAAGTYTVSIRGIGNYTGTVGTTQSYLVEQNTIAKVTVSGASSAKCTGLQMNPYTVKIGKNVLPSSDYTITWYRGQGKTMSDTPMLWSPIFKGKYTAVIKVQGSNLKNTAKKTEIKKNFTIK